MAMYFVKGFVPKKKLMCCEVNSGKIDNKMTRTQSLTFRGCIVLHLGKLIVDNNYYSTRGGWI